MLENRLGMFPFLATMCAFLTRRKGPLLSPVACLLTWLCVMSMVSGGTDLEKCFVVTIYGLKTAQCNNLNLKTIPKDMDRDLKVLHFNDNQLTYLGEVEFREYARLQEVQLVRNRIEVIVPNAFQGLRNLQILNLEGNKLHDIPTETFKHLKSVRILSFKSNPLRHIAKHSFDELQNVEELNFENCWLEQVEPQSFQGLIRLNEINLANNELKTLSSEMESSLPPSLEVLRLYSNPWVCDCRLRWLRDWIASSKINWDFAHKTPTCSGPPAIDKIDWRALKPDQFACPARIIASNSTSIELPVGGNVTIECNVFGDPEPDITWIKDSKQTKNIGIIHKVVVNDIGEKQIKSSLSLYSVKLQQAGDYKCIAKNFAGRSEVTYKLWIEGIGGGYVDPGQVEDGGGMSKEAYLGIGVVVLVLILVAVICAIYCLKRRDNKRHEYKVRDYKKPGLNTPGAGGKSDDPLAGGRFDEEEAVVAKTTVVAITSNNEVEKRELLEKKDSGGSAASSNKRVITAQTTSSPDTAAESKQLLPTTPSPPPPPPPQPYTDKPRDEETESFQMKIFSNYKPEEAPKEAGQKEEPTFAKLNGKVTNKDTPPPDILRNGKHAVVGNTTANHKVVAVPPPTVPNHLESSHQRAAENPYAKPSDLRPAKKKSGSADDLLDSKTRGKRRVDEHQPKPKDRAKADKEVTFKEPPITRVKIRDPSPKSRDHHKHCNNPVCLKDHVPPEPAPSSPPHIRSSQSLQGMDMLSNGSGLNREIDVDHIEDPVYHRGVDRGGYYSDRGGHYSDSGYVDPQGYYSDRYVDRYRTLPAKSSRSGGGRPQYSPPSAGSPRHHTSPQPYQYQTLQPRGQRSASPTKHPGGAGHRNSPTRGGSYGYQSANHVPYSVGGGPVSPRSATSPEDNITYGPLVDSPGSSGGRSSGGGGGVFQGTATLDDLLSPPFPNLADTATAKHTKDRKPKNPPKPGEKDEFGTAV